MLLVVALIARLPQDRLDVPIRFAIMTELLRSPLVVRSEVDKPFTIVVGILGRVDKLRFRMLVLVLQVLSWMLQMFPFAREVLQVRVDKEVTLMWLRSHVRLVWILLIAQLLQAMLRRDVALWVSILRGAF